MKRLCKQLAALMLAFTLLAVGSAPALALTSADYDLTRKGSITVTLQDPKTGSPLVGGELTVYSVAKVQKDNANLSFVYTNGFEDCGVTLGDLSESELADALEAARPASAEGMTASIGSDGKAVLEKLPLGVYLVTQSVACSGYEKIDPFVVTIPLTVEESLLYDVEAQPKVGTLTHNVPPDEPDEPDTPEEPVKPVPPVTPTQPEQPTTPTNPEAPAEDDPSKRTPPDTDNPDGWVLNGRPDAKNPNAPDADHPDGWVLNGRPLKGLIQTGQLNWPVPVMICAGALLLALGIVLHRKRR